MAKYQEIPEFLLLNKRLNSIDWHIHGFRYFFYILFHGYKVTMLLRSFDSFFLLP
ncbi:unnamed protein product, partial [Staurois parvus]